MKILLIAPASGKWRYVGCNRFLNGRTFHFSPLSLLPAAAESPPDLAMIRENGWKTGQNLDMFWPYAYRQWLDGRLKSLSIIPASSSGHRMSSMTTRTSRRRIGHASPWDLHWLRTFPTISLQPDPSR